MQWSITINDHAVVRVLALKIKKDTFFCAWRICNCYGFFLVIEIRNWRQTNSAHSRMYNHISIVHKIIMVQMSVMIA